MVLEDQWAGRESRSRRIEPELGAGVVDLSSRNLMLLREFRNALSEV